MIDIGLILKILEPIWTTKTETASRVRSRIELILDWATVRGYRAGENPARWKGHLATILPKRSSVQQVKHMKALSIDKMGEFMGALKQKAGVAPVALEFLILTATRTNEVIGATWSEINFDEAIWIIPSERMKAQKEHRVPLSPRAIQILKQMAKLPKHEFIFPGWKRERPLSNMAMLTVVRKLQFDCVPHGFRSTFRDWCSEYTSYPREVCEAALAHVIGNKVEAAYRRGDLLQKRRKLMSEWSRFCAMDAKKQAQVVGIGSGRSGAKVL